MSRSTDALLYLAAYREVKRRANRLRRKVDSYGRLFDQCSNRLTQQCQLLDQRELKAQLYNTDSAKENAKSTAAEVDRLTTRYQKLEELIIECESDLRRALHDRHAAQTEYSLWFVRWLTGIDDILLAQYAVMQQYGLSNERPASTEIRVDADGTLHIFYGGDLPPHGKFHGHLIVDQNGAVGYHRLPYTVLPPKAKSTER